MLAPHCPRIGYLLLSATLASTAALAGSPLSLPLSLPRCILDLFSRSAIGINTPSESRSGGSGRGMPSDALAPPCSSAILPQGAVYSRLKPAEMKRITITRKLVQAICFAVIAYGGFFFGPALDRGRGEILSDSGYSGTFEKTPGIRWVEREKVALNLHLPATTCYYQHKGLFSGCSLLFLSEHLTWLTPLVHVLPHLLLLLVLMFTLGRLWCGWACPFGFLSDLLSYLRQLLGLDHRTISRRFRNALVWIKYILLFSTLGLSLLAAVPALASKKGSLFLPFCQMCLGKFASPFLSFATICWTNYRDGITSTLSVLGLLTFISFFFGLTIRRFYCRICPIGGLTAPFNRFGLVSLRKQADRCTRCGACARVCPVDNLTVFEGRHNGAVDACECTLCLRCVEACPEKGCLRFVFLNQKVGSS
jgi:ferredoxin-type protein NapH